MNAQRKDFLVSEAANVPPPFLSLELLILVKLRLKGEFGVRWHFSLLL